MEGGLAGKKKKNRRKRKQRTRATGSDSESSDDDAPSPEPQPEPSKHHVAREPEQKKEKKKKEKDKRKRQVPELEPEAAQDDVAMADATEPAEKEAQTEPEPKPVVAAVASATLTLTGKLTQHLLRSPHIPSTIRMNSRNQTPIHIRKHPLQFCHIAVLLALIPSLIHFKLLHCFALLAAFVLRDEIGFFECARPLRELSRWSTVPWWRSRWRREAAVVLRLVLVLLLMLGCVAGWLVGLLLVIAEVYEVSAALLIAPWVVGGILMALLRLVVVALV